MRTIAIDTSHAAGSVVARDDEGVARRFLGEPAGHARLLTAAIAAATAERGWEIAAADLVAVVRGPGSFTGLRVGVATAQAIAWAGGCRLLGVSGFEIAALDAAADQGWRGSPIEVAFDAGRGEVYAATVRPDGADGWTWSTANLMAAEAWMGTLPPRSQVTGPALETMAARLVAAGHAIAVPAVWFPSATTAAAVAVRRAATGEFHQPANLVPDYLRPHYAAERRPADRP